VCRSVANNPRFDMPQTRNNELTVGLCDDTGQTGLGKSTLINTIFASHLIDSKGRLTPNEPVRSTTEIQTVSHSTSP
jgi:predicted GTPase